MPKGIYKRKKVFIDKLIKRNKSLKNRLIVSKALKGHGFSKETIEKMKRNHADFNGSKNPNWRGDNVGIIGVHVWLKKYFKKKMICEFCGKIGKTPLSIDWAKLRNKPYTRDRNNFIELCRSCHKKYDRKDRKGNGNEPAKICC